MYKTFTTLAVALVLAAGSRIALADSQSPPPVILQDMTRTGLLGYFSSLYGVPQQSLDHTISCESTGNRYAHHVGPLENDYGLVQINLLSHPDISVAQAEDPVFAIAYLARNIREGNAPAMWVTCYKKH